MDLVETRVEPQPPVGTSFSVHHIHRPVPGGVWSTGPRSGTWTSHESEPLRTTDQQLQEIVLRVEDVTLQSLVQLPTPPRCPSTGRR